MPDTDECVMHRGRIAPNGYGMIGKSYAHRLSYEKYVGPIPEGLQIDHLCRNRACINHRHMEPVTSSENALRGNTGRNPKLSSRKLTPDAVRVIRASPLSNRKLAVMFGVSHEAVRTARSEQTYAEVR